MFTVFLIRWKKHEPYSQSHPDQSFRGKNVFQNEQQQRGIFVEVVHKL